MSTKNKYEEEEREKGEGKINIHPEVYREDRRIGKAKTHTPNVKIKKRRGVHKSKDKNE